MGPPGMPSPGGRFPITGLGAAAALCGERRAQCWRRWDPKAPSPPSRHPTGEQAMPDLAPSLVPLWHWGGGHTLGLADLCGLGATSVSHLPSSPRATLCVCPPPPPKKPPEPTRVTSSSPCASERAARGERSQTGGGGLVEEGVCSWPWGDPVGGLAELGGGGGAGRGPWPHSPAGPVRGELLREGMCRLSGSAPPPQLVSICRGGGERRGGGGNLALPHPPGGPPTTPQTCCQACREKGGPGCGWRWGGGESSPTGG